ncbi:MAG: sulfotransferase family 2 domain-containing protein [Marinicellaceae bacterium]
MSQKTNIKSAAEIKKQWDICSDSDNFEKNFSILQKHMCNLDGLSLESNLWIFSHIPKTAGTSLENYLAQLFLIQEILHINAPDLNNFPELLSVKQQFPNYIAGHHPMHGLLYQLLPRKSIVHITMLREPVSRILSYFNYIKSRPTHSLHHTVKDITFDAFLEQPMPEINNGQSRRLAGILHSGTELSDLELYEKAKLVIDKCFTFVGVTEKFEDFLLFVESKTGLSIHRTPRKNQSKIILHKNELSHEHLIQLKSNNAADILLYDYVLNKFMQMIEPSI